MYRLIRSPTYLSLELPNCIQIEKKCFGFEYTLTRERYINIVIALSIVIMSSIEYCLNGQTSCLQEFAGNIFGGQYIYA